jgi:hypothetical protein
VLKKRQAELQRQAQSISLSKEDKEPVLKELSKISFILLGLRRNKNGSKFWDFIPVHRTTTRLSRLNR